MLRRVALVRTDVLEELSASFIRMTRFGELGTLAVTSNITYKLPATIHQADLSPLQRDPPDTLDDGAIPTEMEVPAPSQHMGDLVCP
jgi:hypothetical protein